MSEPGALVGLILCLVLTSGIVVAVYEAIWPAKEAVGACAAAFEFDTDVACPFNLAGGGEWEIAPEYNWGSERPPGTCDVDGVATLNYGITSIGLDGIVWLTDAGYRVLPEQRSVLRMLHFRNCKFLTQMTLPNTVTYIGQQSFQGCTSLSSIHIPIHVVTIGFNSFQGCTNLSSVTFAESTIVKYSRLSIIRAFAFQGCTSLTSISIPESVRTIECWAFAGCHSLTKVVNAHLAPNTDSISADAFPSCFVGSDLCVPCAGRSSIELPETVKVIGAYAFQGCSHLVNLIIPDGVTQIGDGAFKDCSLLSNIVIPDNVTHIGDKAFQGCNLISSFSISSAANIGSDVFDGACPSYYYRRGTRACDCKFGYAKAVNVANELESDDESQSPSQSLVPSPPSLSSCVKDFSDESFEWFADDESYKQWLVIYISVPIICVVVVVVYIHIIRKNLGLPNFEQHLWIWFGIFFTILDLCTDWATYFINIGMHGNDATEFSLRYSLAGGDVEAIRHSCLTFCILGTLLTPIETAVGYMRFAEEHKDDDSVALLLFAPLICMFLEDIPQLVVNVIYIHTTGIELDTNGYLAATSLGLSVIMIVYNFVRFIINCSPHCFSTCQSSNCKTKCEDCCTGCCGNCVGVTLEWITEIQ
eukprot:m.261596 g.261596  ORF g.261596 m.261596 type:complete len:644 (-) comp42476_c0_seq1:155-2086(-)